jgi:hypothetical protein
MAIKNNRDYPLSPTPQPRPVTNTRVNADSLMKRSYEKKIFANEQERLAKGQIKNNGGNEPLTYTTNRVSGPSGNQRMQIVRNARQSASMDSAIAVKAKPSLTPKKK